MMVDWSKSKYFLKEEFDCQATGENKMQESFILQINQLRSIYGKPMLISSGFRSKKHPIEAKKKSGGGMHTTGLASDVLIHGKEAYILLNLIIQMKVWTGIGFNQKGAFEQRFIHIDMGTDENRRPTIWSY
tara:strand:- start:402 stop:794 length:393 start_codon:yes stop_codon:yes gene_type:complete